MISATAKIHTHALIEENVSIGDGTRVWAFSHILPGAVVGENCNICDHTLIENGVILGNRVTVKSGVYIWTGVEIADDVFIGPCVAFTNDIRPRSQQHLDQYPRTYLAKGCSIGANSVILPGVTVGRWAMVGAGSVVTKSVPDHALVVGVPARIKSWVCQCGLRLKVNKQVGSCDCGQQYELKMEETVE